MRTYEEFEIIYKNLRHLSFIRCDGSDGIKLKSMNEAALKSVVRALVDINKTGYKYEIGNLGLDNLIFDKDNNLISIENFDDIKVGDPINDFVYLIINYVDMVEEYYPWDYAFNLIISLLDIYNPRGLSLDLGFRLYWSCMDEMKKYKEGTDLYNKYEEMLEFIIYYKDYFDEPEEY